MNLIDPKVELWSEVGVTPEQHIARCARVCYGHDGEGKDPKRLVESLIKSGHVSMLRHATCYYAFPPFFDTMCFSPYWTYTKDTNKWRYVSANLQTLQTQNATCVDEKREFSAAEFLEECKKQPELFFAFRLTFCLTTQISTSRELNRVSPNNIAERSTRYCSSKDGLEICTPWWFDEYEREKSKEHEPTNEDWIVLRDKVEAYSKACENAESAYVALLALGAKPQDARGVLPLDTATKVVYTYSVKEWQHILELRYYEKTGKAQPNAKLIMGMVRDQINDFAKSHGINYLV